jgi:hypothetical protein
VSHPYSKPIAVLALIQLAVVFLGILAAGATQKVICDAMKDDLPRITRFILNQGLVLALVPLLWAGVTGHVVNRVESRQGAGTALVVSGVLLAVGLAVFMLAGTLGQMFIGHTL